MIRWIWLFFYLFATATHGSKLHEHMTKEEIQLVFNVKHDAIHELEYEVTPILHYDELKLNQQQQKRSSPTIHLRAFDQKYTLYLEKNDHVLIGNNTPVFIAKPNKLRSSGGSNVLYSRIQYPLPSSLKLYHDLENRAAVTVFVDEENNAHVNGIVGDDIVIRPLPARLHKEVLSKYPGLSTSSFTKYDPFSDDSFSDDSSENSFPFGAYQPTHHVVMKPNLKVDSAYLQPIKTSWNQLNQWFKNDDYHQTNDIWSKIPREPVTFRPNTKEPYTWWPKSQFTWWSQPTTKAPFTWRPKPTTKEPFTWWPQPTTAKPFNWWPQEPITWWPKPTTKAPDSWWSQFVTNAPNFWRPDTKKPFYWQPITEAPTTSRPTTMKPVTVQPTTKQAVTTRPTMSPVTQSDTVYPELLIAVDHETFATHGNSIEEVSKYMAAFWNAVDLRYREMENPKVRLNIAGLIIPQKKDGTPYMERYTYGSKALYADKTVREIGNYFANEKEFPYDTYDIVVGITHRNLGGIGKDGSFKDGTTGIAMFEGACATEFGQAAALVRDKGGFNGITTAAHELAHSLGAPHDGDDTAKIPGGPCSWDDGYLMSYQRQDSRGMHWSKCSKRAMQIFMKSSRGACLKNKPTAGTPYPKILPGRLLSRDEQCKRSLNMVSYKEQEDNCAVLWCAEYIKVATGTQIRGLTEYRPPAEGSYCGEGKICLDAQCVKDPEV